MEAVRLIDVEYEELPVVNSIEKALAGDVLIHDSWDDYIIYGATHPVKDSNIIDTFRLISGNAEAGFAEADVIAESEFYCSMLQHTVIEPHVAIADADERHIHVITPNQSPFGLRTVLANAFGYRADCVRITCADIGGAFGGKVEGRLEPIAIALSLASRKPVKLVYDRGEEFSSTVTRAPCCLKSEPAPKRTASFARRALKSTGTPGLTPTSVPGSITTRLRLERSLFYPQRRCGQLLCRYQQIPGVGRTAASALPRCAAP